MSDTADQPDVSALDTWVSFDDLKRAGIVTSWKVLREWQRDKRVGFPLGRLLAPNTRRWSKEREIDPWLKNRPVEREGFDDDETADVAKISVTPLAAITDSSRSAEAMTDHHREAGDEVIDRIKASG
jgi:hypothetical protein